MSDFYIRVPVDKTASIVTQKASQDNTYKPKNKDSIINVDYWENPRLMVELPANKEFKDFTCKLFGRMIVVGYLGSKKWQCKCQCGRYFSRSSKVLSRGVRRDEEICYECYQFTRIKKREYERKTGKFTADDYDWFA